RRLLKNPSPSTKRASHRSRATAAKAASISPLVLALITWICSPRTRAASGTSFNVASVDRALAGLTNTAMRAAFGTSDQFISIWVVSRICDERGVVKLADRCNATSDTQGVLDAEAGVF